MPETEIPQIHQGVSYSVQRCPACGTAQVRSEILVLSGDGVGPVGYWVICMCTEEMRCDRCPAEPLPFGWPTFARHLAAHDA